MRVEGKIDFLDENVLLGLRSDGEGIAGSGQMVALRECCMQPTTALSFERISGLRTVKCTLLHHRVTY